MSEQILNQGSMYESIQGIQELNQVEGFDPSRRWTGCEILSGCGVP